MSEVYYVTLAFMLLLIRMLIGNPFIQVHVTCFVSLTLSSESGYSVTSVVYFWVCHQQSPHLNVSHSQLRFRAPCGNPVTGSVYCSKRLTAESFYPYECYSHSVSPLLFQITLRQIRRSAGHATHDQDASPAIQSCA